MGATELVVGTSLGEDGRYRLGRILGTGGMSSVWLAEDERLRRPVAVKVLSDSLALDAGYVSRFEREARVAARLSHPNLVNVFDFSAAPPRPYLAMEYVPGPTLGELLHGRARADWDPESVFRQLMRALVYVHGAGIIHRDIKPSNVLVGHDGRARLTDFGIARPSDGEALTNTGLVIGTAHYIAPEVMRGQRPDERSDLYSCGVLLLDCLHGRAPGRLQAVADRLTEEEPRKRPASAEEVLELLDRPVTAPTAVVRSPSTFRRPRRVPIPALLLSALALLVLLLVIASTSGSSSPSAPSASQPPAGSASLTHQLTYLERAIGHARR